MIDRNTQSLLYALVFLLMLEGGLRLASGSEDTVRLSGEKPVAVVLGSSRSMRAIRPSTVESALDTHGVEDAWVANLSALQLTTAGLYQRYMEELHPHADASQEHAGVLAVEVRASGLNDNFMTPAEQAWLERNPLPAETSSGPEASVSPVVDHLRAGRLGAASRTLLGSLAVARLNESVRHLTESSPAPEVTEDAMESPTLATSGKPWALGERGWSPFPNAQAPGLKQVLWEPHYRNNLLRDYQLGGIQTRCLVRLVRQARADGFRVVFFVMPITEIHRGFHQPGRYQDFLDHVQRLAADENVSLADLDARMGLDVSEFFDTHHVNGGAVPRVSERFAEWVLLPELR